MTLSRLRKELKSTAELRLMMAKLQLDTLCELERAQRDKIKLTEDQDSYLTRWQGKIGGFFTK